MWGRREGACGCEGVIGVGAGEIDPKRCGCEDTNNAFCGEQLRPRPQSRSGAWAAGTGMC